MFPISRGTDAIGLPEGIGKIAGGAELQFFADLQNAQLAAAQQKFGPLQTNAAQIILEGLPGFRLEFFAEIICGIAEVLCKILQGNGFFHAALQLLHTDADGFGKTLI
mgnify:CR=1 FL=1